MKEIRNHLMTFLMLTMLILVSSINNKLKISHIELDKTNFDHNYTDVNKTNPIKLNSDSIDKNEYKRDTQLPENSITRDETKKKKEEIIQKSSLIKSQQKNLNNSNIFSNGKNSTDHKAIESVASSFPFVVSLNLIETSSNNTVDLSNKSVNLANTTQLTTNFQSINSSLSDQNSTEGNFINKRI